MQTGTSTDSERFYQPSGAFTPVGTLVMLSVGCLVAAVLAPIYAYFVLYDFVSKFNFILCFLMGFGVGWGSRFGMRLGKVRSPIVSLTNGALAGLVAVYLSWVVWLHGFFVRMNIDLWPFDPEQLWQLIRTVAANPMWAVSRPVPTTLTSYTFWAIEAVIIVGTSVLVCDRHSDGPFCETCRAWPRTIFRSLRRGLPEHMEALQASLNQSDLTAFRELGPPAASDIYLEAEASVCPKCQSVGFFSVRLVKPTVDSLGRQELKPHKFVEGLILDPAGIQQATEMAASVAMT